MRFNDFDTQLQSDEFTRECAEYLASLECQQDFEKMLEQECKRLGQ